MIKKAFKDLYNKEFYYTSKIKYSKKFTAYNANIRKRGNYIEVHASHLWKDIGEEIQIGLIQHLLMKLFKDKKDTFYTKLYSDFIRKLADYTPKTLSDPQLEESFNRINAKYFNELMEIPNLQWGKNSTTQLGLYNYHNDTVTISSIFKKHMDIVDYILYHELLHKQEKFKSKNGRSHHHTPRFRKLEKEYEDYKLMEGRITKIVRRKRLIPWL